METRGLWRLEATGHRFLTSFSTFCYVVFADNFWLLAGFGDCLSILSAMSNQIPCARMGQLPAATTNAGFFWKQGQVSMEAVSTGWKKVA